MNSKITVLNELNFDSFIGKSELTLIDFWADWCGPCRMLAPVIEEISEESCDVYIGKVDVDQSERLAIKYGINSIPTLLLFKTGELKQKSIGVKSKAQIVEMIEKNK